jgi:L-threonylcarbamoyladenylate synthase
VKTEIVGTDEASIARAVALLGADEVVALPTETVYGLAANALSATAVEKIFAAKERPHFDPLIVHLPDVEWLDRVAVIDAATRPLAQKLIERFWPGPLTLVLPRTDRIPDIVTAGAGTVAVRLSKHPVFAEIARKFGKPLAAPSANRFGRISPTAAGDVWDELQMRIPMIVDGGRTEFGIESTIVALRNARMEILRRGPISERQLREFGDVIIAEMSSVPEAPGQLPSHYAPRTPLVLVDDVASYPPSVGKRCGLLYWSDAVISGEFVETRRLTAIGDLREAAANLFRYLRELDDAGLELIVAETLPEEDLSNAIMDRLRRAAARKAG